MHYLLWVVILVTLAYNVQTVSGQIVWTSQGTVIVPENTPADTYVFNVSVKDAESLGVFYTIERGSDVFIFKDQFNAPSTTSFTGRVYTKLILDYEEYFSVSVKFRATTSALPVQTDTTDVTVNVEDQNDVTPEFSQAIFSAEINENTPVGTTIFEFSVTDVELSNKYLNVSCDTSHFKGQDCDVFRLLVKPGASNIKWEGYLYLAQPLDYETKTLYELPIVAKDGATEEKKSMKIYILNIQDTPPQFFRIEPAIVQEELPAGTVVQTVEAYDGDYIRGDPNGNQIQYEFVLGPDDVYGDLFEIDPNTGVIRTKKILDMEGSYKNPPDVPRVYPEGYFIVTVLAREIFKNGTVGNTPETTVRRSIRITVADINDNRPVFDRTNFEVSISEDTPRNSILPHVNLFVRDTDVSVNNANFTLTLTPQLYSAFELSTNSVTREATATIFIRNSTALDYETPPNRYILYVTATEQSFSPTTATVTVNVLDFNDNDPRFIGVPFNASVSETAPGGTSVIQIMASDADTGAFGVDGIVYSLTGVGSHLFRIDAINGFVRVEACPPPVQAGEFPCIDFERTKSYTFTVTATDNNGIGGFRSNTADLTIHILDENDNPPVIQTRDIVSYIEENQFVPSPPVIVKAIDADTVGGPISFSLVSGDQYWQINPVTGVVTATKPIQYNDTPGSVGYFTLTALVTDGKFSQTTDITIYVLEVNDNAPIFVQQIYRDTIREGQRGPAMEYILTVSATDADSATSSAGVINYNIEVGGKGKFNLDFNNGSLSTAPNAFFDFDVQREYAMTIFARDNGRPQQTGSVTVIITVLDENNKDPYIRPQTRRADVYENVNIGHSFYTMDGEDPDAGAVLNYRFVETKAAYTPEGNIIDRTKYNYTNLFTINATTGVVRTAARLDRDQASVVSYTVEVIDVTASPQQTGTGTLIITILEYNDQAPYFLPYQNITILEEQPSGAFVMSLLARDEDDPIDEYRMFENPRNFFSIGRLTGVVVTTDKVIDFEEIEETYFIAQVWDGGFPRLSATASVHVTIVNINDKSPVFDQPSYRVENFQENAVGNTPVITVRATDADKGHFGEVRYYLTDRFNRFYMNNDTGEVFVRPGAVLDREATPTIDILITAYDSQLDPSVRRFTPVSVFIYLADVNDNPPVFTQPEYIRRIPETIPINTEILQVSATDRDIGNNARITFTKLPGSGDIEELFSIGSQSGRIRVSKSVLRKTGTYRFLVAANDPDYTSYANITIIVFEAANSQPIWVIPPRTNMTIQVLESQYLGMVVFEVEAKDEDSSRNGVVDYGFSVGNNTFTAKSPEFNINRITGVIRAERVFDREERDRYVLILVARDQGNPYLETQRSLTVEILDVNDNVPVFPQSGDGQTIPYRFSIPENAPNGSFIDSVVATDADLNPKIYYYIIGGNEDKTFRVNRNTGELFLNSPLDREKKDRYTIYIQATNNISDDSVITNRKKRALDPSIATVIILVGNTNDEPPVFTQDRYHGCISEEAPVKQSIVQVQAIDKDAYGNIRYRIVSGNQRGALGIDETSGVISNNILMEGQENFVLSVQADDSAAGVTLSAANPANVLIFVTQKSKEAKIIVRQPASEVRTFLENYQTTLRSFRREDNSRYFDYICFSAIRDHVLDDGQSTTLWSDVYLSAICSNCFGNSYYIYTDSELERELNFLMSQNPSQFDLLYVRSIESATGSVEYLDRTPTLVVMIIIILLFVLIIVFLVIACICIRRSYNQKKLALIQHHHVEQQTFDPMPVEKSVNPVYDNQAFEQEEPHAQYAKVLKRREMEPERPPQPEPEPSPRDDYPEPVDTLDVIIKDDDDDDDEPSPERSPLDSPRLEQAEEEYIIETQVL